MNLLCKQAFILIFPGFVTLEADDINEINPSQPVNLQQLNLIFLYRRRLARQSGLAAFSFFVL
jgi:hypothetical protein